MATFTIPRAPPTAVLVLLAAPLVAAAVPNGGFESGDLTGWTLVGSLPDIAASESGVYEFGAWHRVVTPAAASRGLYGLAMGCADALTLENQGGPAWWCTAGVETTVRGAREVALDVRVTGPTDFWGIALYAQACDALACATYGFDAPELRTDAFCRQPTVRCETVVPGVWVDACLDVAAWYAALHGRAIAPEFRLQLNTYEDEGASGVHVDNVRTECGS